MEGMLVSPTLTWSAAKAPAVALAGVLAFHVVPALGPLKSFKPMWDRYVELREGTEPIGLYGHSEASAFYYSANRIVRIYDTVEMADFLNGPGVKFLIVSDRELERAGPSLFAGSGRLDLVEQSHPSHTLVRYDPKR